MIPHTLPRPYDLVNWVPVNVAAKMIAKKVAEEVARPKRGRPGNCLSVFHILNPKPAPWSSIATVVQQTPGGSEIVLVPFRPWLTQLQALAKSAPDTSIMDTHPAVRLLEWFEAMEIGQTADRPAFSFSTRKAKKRIPLMSKVPEADRLTLVRMWMRDVFE